MKVFFSCLAVVLAEVPLSADDKAEKPAAAQQSVDRYAVPDGNAEALSFAGLA